MFSLLCEVSGRTVSRRALEKLTDEEWSRLWELSLRHKVGPVFVSSLHALDIPIPDCISAPVGRFQRGNVLKSLRYSAELARVARIFAESNIRILGFKGVALQGVLGQQPGERHCGDMDILLIDPNQLIEADKLLVSAGYRRNLDVDSSILGKPEMMMHFNTKDLHYVHEGKEIDMELHISLFHTKLLPISNEEFYQRRDEILIGKAPVPVMCREDYLLYLLLHGSVSVWHRLKWLVDIPLVSNNGVDYMDDAFYKKSKGLGVQRMVLQGLSLANQFLKMPVSENIAECISSGEIKKMNVRGPLHALQSEKSPQDRSRFRFLGYRFFVCFVYWPTMRSEFRFKLACVRTLFVSLKDYQLLPLPVYLHWLYIPLRPLLWLVRPYRKP